MEATDFIDKFKEQFIDENEIEIDLNTEFRQLSSWDSLTGMAVLVMIEDEYGVQMTDKDLKGCIIVGDIYNFIQSHK